METELFSEGSSPSADNFDASDVFSTDASPKDGQTTVQQHRDRSSWVNKFQKTTQLVIAAH